LKTNIITACTGEKAVHSDQQLTLDDFQAGKEKVKERESALADVLMPAGEIYTGEQHVRLMRGINAVRKAAGGKKKAGIDLKILSAGYGMIPESRKVAPYEVTFATMKAKELRSWADTLKVPQSFRSSVKKSYDFGLILLGDNYLKACDLKAEVEFGGPTLLLCGTGMAKRLPEMENVRVLPISNPEAKRFSCGMVGLKGDLGSRLIHGVNANPEIADQLMDPGFDVLGWLDGQPGWGKNAEVEKGSAKIKSNTKSLPKEKQRFRFFTPRKNATMHYFIPEWDDRVDPDYDFSCDGITEGREPYTHDVYAHEIYAAPNYDGILVSKSVIEDNNKKKQRITEIGIHAHIRVPRNFPVMGDCGAFNYIDQYEPPYTTEETVQFYQNLDFDYGVSIDHLIVPSHMKRTVYCYVDADGNEHEITEQEYQDKRKAGVDVEKSIRRSKDLFADSPYVFTFEEKDLTEAKRRWELTLANANDFVGYHKKVGADFTAIAGCQGWNVESQTEMFKQQQEMGYGYIALGGLVRSKTTQILEILESVNKIRKPSTKIHLFGVARPDALKAFQAAGVNSIDSARFLRQAWLSATSNYYTGDGEEYADVTQKGRIAKGEDRWRYAAVRIPPVHREGGSSLTAKAKKIVQGGYDEQKLTKQEEKALKTIHAFDRGEISLEKTLEIICEYDQLMGGDPRNEPHYRRVLEEKPWKKCPCAVCQKTGIDTVVFRRNNRNRRRGFHNTWWFFQLFSHITGDTAESQ
jgi:hypothetical protein